VLRRRRSSQSPRRNEIQQIQGGGRNQPAVFGAGNPISMWRQLFEPHDPNVTTPDLPQMSARERHRELRPHLDTEHLQPGHSGCDRVGGQGEHDSTDPEAGRICAGGSDVNTLGNAPEAGPLEHLPRQPDSTGV